MTSPEVGRAPLSENKAVVVPVADPAGISGVADNNIGSAAAGRTGGGGGSASSSVGGGGHQQQQQQQQGGSGGKKQVTFMVSNNSSSGKRNQYYLRNQQQQHGRRNGYPTNNVNSQGGTVSGDEDASEHNAKRSHNFRGPLRKRSYSFTEGHCRSVSSILPSKRWKNMNKHMKKQQQQLLGKNVLPSKFLLGGNIRDPLNLNSLSDEKISRMVNAITPESSPLPTPKHRKAEYKIEVLIPPNISDPLNLNCGVDENEYESQLISPSVGAASLAAAAAKKKKFRYRKRFRSTSHHHHHQGKLLGGLIPPGELLSGDESEQEHPLNQSLDAETLAKAELSREKLAETSAKAADKKVVVEAQQQPQKQQPQQQHQVPPGQQQQQQQQSGCKRPSSIAVSGPLKKILKQNDSEIVSPVVPQPGQQQNSPKKHKGSKNNHQNAKRSDFQQQGQPPQQQKKQQQQQQPKFKPQDQRFEYGNYNRYYGYRTFDRNNQQQQQLHQQEQLLQQQDLRLRYFKPEWFSGKDVLDIGCNVGNVTSSVAKLFNPRSVVGIDIDKKLIEAARKNLKRLAVTTSSCNNSSNQEYGGEKFPKSMAAMFGPLDPAAGVFSDAAEQQGKFPDNVRFVCGNYVLESDELLEAAQPEFDVIMCLSTTKWLHLNFGDEGLKRAFKRMHAQLRPGGILILEAQGFASYRKRKRLTERIFQNFQNIKLRPENFSYYLLHEVGFGTGRTIAVPHHSAKGFQRPLQVFTKRYPFSSRSVSSRQTTPYLGPSPSGSASPMFPPQQGGRCYAPSLTPMYKPSPLYPPTPKTPKGRQEQESGSSTPRPGPSNRVSPFPDNGNFSRPQDPMPEDDGASPAYYDGYMGATPNYSPGETPSYSGYSGYTPGQSGITPGYSGPSPEPGGSSSPRGGGRNHSPVYSGPEPGAISNASTPGHNEDYVGPGYTPSYSAYTPSNPGTPQHPYSPGRFSPGNATPKPGCRTPDDTPNPNAPSPNSTSSSPLSGQQIQQSEVTGNTTPHPGPSGCSPATEDRNNPRYFWYGYSGNVTPQSGHFHETSSNPSSPQLQMASHSSPREDSSPAAVAEPSSSPQQPSAAPAAEDQEVTVTTDESNPATPVGGGGGGSSQSNPNSPGSPF